MSTVPPVFLSQLFTRKCFAFAGSFLLFYDYLLTLPLEVAHIWNEPRTVVKSLFLANRYGNLAGQTFIMLEETGYLSNGSRNFCMAFVLCIPFFAVLSGESIRLFVVMRACAILGCTRTIGLSVAIAYALYATCFLVVLACLSVRYVVTIPFEYLNEVGLCISPSPIHAWPVCLIPLALDTVVFGLVWHTLYRFTRGHHNTYHSGLIRLLVQDALLFYIATLFNDLICIVCWTVWATDPRSFVQILVTYPFLTVVGQRLVFNLRRYRTRPDSMHDLSVEVNRQIAALVETPSSEELEMGTLGMDNRVPR